MDSTDDMMSRGLVAVAKAASGDAEPVTYRDRDIETMSRDELLAAMREIAPALGEIERTAQELVSLLRPPVVFSEGEVRARHIGEEIVSGLPVIAREMWLNGRWIPPFGHEAQTWLSAQFGIPQAGIGRNARQD